jgi:site-specific recombinase XerD
MVMIKYNYRFFLKPNGRVYLRVRWDKKETSSSLKVFACPEKWDSENQQAIRNTNHEVNGKVYPARVINKEINKAIDLLSDLFAAYATKNESPSVSQVKAELSSKLFSEVTHNIEVIEAPKPEQKLPPLKSICQQFITEYSIENNIHVKTQYKYRQTWNLFMAYCPKPDFRSMGKSFLNGFKSWLIENGYKNSSITKYFRYLKCIFRWMQEKGYSVDPDCFSYKTKLSVPLKSVIYLKYDEVLQFEQFQFPKNKEYLARARDYFCFMSYTSLRYSDLKGLKKASITDNCIDMYAQKTKGRLKIPLVSHAVRILEKYIDKTPGEYVFAVPSNQKLNDFIKEAAEMAGLDREVIDTSFCGTERIELVMKLHEAISCHCARRTFVCISLSLGIPQSVVMTMTGHADYETMRPYISISDETSKRELVKWEVGSTKSELTKLIDQMDQPQLEMMVSKAQELLMS